MGHIACMEEMRNANRVSVGNPKGKKPLGRSRRRWKDKIKMNRKDKMTWNVNRTHLAQDSIQWQVRGALKHFVTIKNFYGEGLLAPRPTPSWRTTPCRLSATDYIVYSQLPSVPGGLPSIRNLRMRHAVVTRDPPNMDPVTGSYKNGYQRCGISWLDDRLLVPQGLRSWSLFR